MIDDPSLKVALIQSYIDNLYVFDAGEIPTDRGELERREGEVVQALIDEIKSSDYFTYRAEGRSLSAIKLGAELVQRAIIHREEHLGDLEWAGKRLTTYEDVRRWRPSEKDKKIVGLMASGSGSTESVVQFTDTLLNRAPNSKIVAITYTPNSALGKRADLLIRTPEREENGAVSILESVMGDLSEESTLLLMYSVAKSIYSGELYSPKYVREEMKEWLQQKPNAFSAIKHMTNEYLERGTRYVGYGLSEELVGMLGNRLKLIAEPGAIQISSEQTTAPLKDQHSVFLFSASTREDELKSLLKLIDEVSTKLGDYDDRQDYWNPERGMYNSPPIFVMAGTEKDLLPRVSQEGKYSLVLGDGKEKKWDEPSIFYILTEVLMNSVYRDIANDRGYTHQVLKDRHNNIRN